MKKFLEEYGNYMVWGVALTSVLGSLYFTEVMNLTACFLCWWQRVAMFPLVVVVGVGIVRKNPDLPLYALPFSVIGLAVAIFQNLLYYGILSESVSPCQIGASCIDPASNYLGYGITIPMLSMIGFAVITVLLIINLKQRKNYE